MIHDAVCGCVVLFEWWKALVRGLVNGDGENVSGDDVVDCG